MFCKKCGKSIDDNSKFCPECGSAQFGHDRADNEFSLWRKKWITYGLIAGGSIVFFGIFARMIRLAVIGAFLMMYCAWQLNSLRKKK